MDAYRVSESEADWPALIDRAAAGEPVVITRDGAPIVELRAASAIKTLKHRSPEAQEAWRRLCELRESLPPSDFSTADLIDQLREERELVVAGLSRR